MLTATAAENVKKSPVIEARADGDICFQQPPHKERIGDIQSTIWDFTVKREHNHTNWKPIKDYSAD